MIVQNIPERQTICYAASAVRWMDLRGWKRLTSEPLENRSGINEWAMEESKIRALSTWAVVKYEPVTKPRAAKWGLEINSKT